ncbi:phage holin family protein [Marinoscillum furvescens]|uniref:Putative superfamily III holin-X n=1 Tax=Marinoscillum furvescens DSM 4134 TaxID=1122208 RepID=A0A3D9LJ67_MARFU|nr:phage holin family protein [Marinoscillum furvescens]REE05853.1 putative superfamily III holin-X [Marinoscillum furvescens DSM 4134]
MSIINNLVDKLSEYIRIKGEKLKLDIIAQVSRLLAHFVAFMTLAIIGLFLLVFLSLALSSYLNYLLDSPHYGYLIVSGFYLVVFVVILLLLRSNRIQQWLEVLFVNLSENISDDGEV